MPRINAFHIVLLLFLLLLSVLEIMAFQKDSHYIYDIPMCMFLLYVVYLLRRALFLLVSHYILFSLFLVLHCLGLFDAYLLYPLGIEYDYWVHAFFGLVSALIIFRWMNLYLANLRYYVVVMFTLFFVLGLSALHELYEYFGALLLGEGEGVLFIGAGDLDQWDTQKDMLNNVIGALIGLLIRYFNNLYARC